MNVFRISPRLVLLLAALVLILVSAIVYKHRLPPPEVEKTDVDTCIDPVEMDDPMVVTYLNNYFIYPPSSWDVPFNMSDQNVSDHSHGQAARIKTILGGMRNGFFVECGAHNGEEATNTFLFEHDYHWSGLLIEPTPESFQQLYYKRRKAYLSPSCLSTTIYPQKVSFFPQGNGGHIIQNENEAKSNNTIQIQCFPLYSFLLALNRTTIDYLSLDVESNELDVLKTIPWDKVNIRTLSVEYYLIPEGKEALREYMEQQGYYVDSVIQIGISHGADDFIFVKNNLVF